MEKKLNDLVARLSDGQLDRREFLTRMAVIPGGVAAAAAVLPMLLVGPVFPGENAPGSRTLGADVEVQEGMLFSFEPSAHEGPMASAKVGATAVVTADGLDIYNTIGTRVQQV